LVHIADDRCVTNPGELADPLGASAAAAATLISGLGDALPRVPPPAALAPTESRFRIYDRLARLQY
jgi:hypothetical protein